VGWRLHLSNQPVTAVQFIPAETPLIAVWDNRHNVHYYNQLDAMPSGEQRFAEQHPPEDLSDDFWLELIASLKAPNGEYLPTVYMAGLNLHQSRDGRLRLYHFQDGSLILEVEGRHIALDRDQDERFIIAGLDRDLGLSGSLDEKGQLHIFQQHVRIGAFDMAMALGVESRLNLVLPDGLGRVLISDGDRVVIVDSAGRIQHERQTHFAVGPVAVSPNGQYIVLGDIDDNLIRVYDSTLRPTHQKHAIDLMTTSRQVQLLASLPGRKAGLSAVDVTDKGAIAFSLGGVICVTDIKTLDALPQPRALL
jgi:WD40 repeat protein